MKTQIIEKKGRQFAVVPLADFERLRRDAEMLGDIRAYDAAKSRDEEAFPAEVAGRLAAGESPIRVFREYRGLTQERLGKMAKVARAYVAQIETGRKSGSISVLSAVAAALKVELDDIVG
jgi:DNA-binding XRE family transcriptional regulator